MKFITHVCIVFVIYALTCISTETHSFSTTQNCIDDIVKLVKEKRSELSTEFLLSNTQASESLLEICKYYVPHKVHKVLKLVDKTTCSTEIPTASDFEENIYKSYVQLLDQLKIYVGGDIPNSFGQLNDRVTGTTKAIFDMTLNRLAGVCLHTDPEKID